MSLKRNVLAVAALLLTAGCVDPEEPGADDRHQLGKADAVGTCAAANGETFCGGQSGGNCWCDDSCAQWGDCCSDRELVCSADETNERWLQSVRFVDSKATGGPPIFTVAYEFGDLGEIVVSCNDNRAATTMSGVTVGGGRDLELVGGDFYCFRLEALVNDLADVTNGYALPSFAGPEHSAEAAFDVADALVTIHIAVEENRVTLLLRGAGQALEFAAP